MKKSWVLFELKFSPHWEKKSSHSFQKQIFQYKKAFLVWSQIYEYHILLKCMGLDPSDDIFC